jgi:hypothetical protein
LRACSSLDVRPSCVFLCLLACLLVDVKPCFLLPPLPS